MIRDGLEQWSRSVVGDWGRGLSHSQQPPERPVRFKTRRHQSDLISAKKAGIRVGGLGVLEFQR